MEGREWMNHFPAAGNVELLQRSLARYQEELLVLRRDDRHGGSIRASLEHWRTNVDVAGIPSEVLQKADRYVEIARDALRSPLSIEGAEGALDQASRLFLPRPGGIS